MPELNLSNLRLYYSAREQAAAGLAAAACEKSTRLLRQLWGLEPPENCRVYIMTSWPGFLFASAPGVWKAYLALTFPLVAWRAGSIWPYAGGWTLAYGRRCAVVGVKPPRLMESANRSIGEQLFLADRNAREKVETVTCHELAHAFCIHLRLPVWLNEGLATRAMEHYLGRPVVRPETLALLGGDDLTGWMHSPRINHPQELVRLYARGYWLTRYMEETRPELLPALLSRRMPHRELLDAMAAAYGSGSELFWREIDGKVRALYGEGGSDGARR